MKCSCWSRLAVLAMSFAVGLAASQASAQFPFHRSCPWYYCPAYPASCAEYEPCEAASPAAEPARSEVPSLPPVEQTQAAPAEFHREVDAFLSGHDPQYDIAVYGVSADDCGEENSSASLPDEGEVAVPAATNVPGDNYDDSYDGYDYEFNYTAPEAARPPEVQPVAAPAAEADEVTPEFEYEFFGYTPAHDREPVDATREHAKRGNAAEEPEFDCHCPDVAEALANRERESAGGERHPAGKFAADFESLYGYGDEPSTNEENEAVDEPAATLPVHAEVPSNDEYAVPDYLRDYNDNYDQKSHGGDDWNFDADIAPRQTGDAVIELPTEVFPSVAEVLQQQFFLTLATTLQGVANALQLAAGQVAELANEKGTEVAGSRHDLLRR